jgi:nucleoside-diphosphate-sugar epimerase
MRILITGANGYLGFNLAKKLLDKGHDLLVISKNTNKLSSILNHCSFIQSYTEDLHLYKQQINEFFPDIVVHFGWWGGNSYKDTNDLDQYHNNIPSNVRFLDLINNLYSKPKFVGIGSFVEYGQVLSKTSETYKEEPINHYGIAKLILKEYSQKFCKNNNLITSMSRRGNCYDNAVVESFLSSLKKEKIRRYIFRTRQEAKADIFDYIEVFYNRARRHQHLGNISPEAFESQTMRAS